MSPPGTAGELTVIASGSVLEDLRPSTFSMTSPSASGWRRPCGRARKKFSLIFKRAPLMAAISDLENSALLEVNDKLLATFGAGREEALRKERGRAGLDARLRTGTG